MKKILMLPCFGLWLLLVCMCVWNSNDSSVIADEDVAWLRGGGVCDYFYTDTICTDGNSECGTVSCYKYDNQIGTHQLSGTDIEYCGATACGSFRPKSAVSKCTEIQ